MKFSLVYSSLTTLSHSLDDINDCNWSPQVHSEHVMTIEELRLQMSSCFTCGVSWIEHHVSLDCSECGGYAMERPCPNCDGTCGAIWKRDLAKVIWFEKKKEKGSELISFFFVDIYSLMPVAEHVG